VQPQLVGSGKDRQAHRQNIGCGIDIPVLSQAEIPVVAYSAFWALPLTKIASWRLTKSQKSPH